MLLEDILPITDNGIDIRNESFHTLSILFVTPLARDMVTKVYGDSWVLRTIPVVFNFTFPWAITDKLGCQEALHALIFLLTSGDTYQ